MARIDVVLKSLPPIVAQDQGLWAQIRKGLSTSATWIFISISWAIIGLLVVLPWAAIAYGVVRLVMWLSRREETAATGS